MKNIITLICTLFISTSAFAAKGPAKATVQVQAVKEKTATKLVFKTIPVDGLVVNAEGPWKLEIKSATGVQTATKELKRSDWKEATAGFELPVTVAPGSKNAEVSYKLTSFVCTKDKSQCFREVIEDKASVGL